jgi:hypothetical protein
VSDGGAEVSQAARAMKKIYVSSTFADLKDERAAVVRAILRLGYHPVAMESYVACDQRPLDKCLGDVRSCAGYVGLIAFRHGFIPPGHDKSITHLEFEEATRAGLMRFVFLLKEGASWPIIRVDPDQSRVRAFRDCLCREVVVDHFGTTEELEAKVTAALGLEFGPGPGPEPLPRREVPALLPYLCDRSEQEYQLGEAVRTHRAAGGGPLVCVVHGAEDQCQEEFLEQLRHVSLPRMLGLDRDRGFIKDYLVDCPSAFHDADSFRRRVLNKLASRVLDQGMATAEELAAEIAGQRGPVLIQAHLLTDDWTCGGPALIDGFLGFWADWPEAASKHLLLILLVVTYQQGEGLGWLRRRSQRRANQQLRAYLRALDVAAVTGVPGLVLDELLGVIQKDAENWARDDAIRRFCGGRHLLDEIRRLYDRPQVHDAGGRIAMLPLAAELTEMLRTRAATRGA